MQDIASLEVQVMSRKSKYQLISEAALAAERTKQSKVPVGIEDEWKRGEDTEISAQPADRPMVKELWALLTKVRTAAFFMEPEEKRIPVVQRINQLHGALLRSKTIKGYVGGTESRQARKLLDSYGPRFKTPAGTEA